MFDKPKLSKYYSIYLELSFDFYYNAAVTIINSYPVLSNNKKYCLFHQQPKT